jgi:hypothetical protein
MTLYMIGSFFPALAARDRVNWTALNYLRNNTRYLPTLVTIITIYKMRIANLDLRSWQSPI